MKLNEITQLNESKFLTDRNEILAWLERTGTINQYKTCVIHDDGTVDLNGAVELSANTPGVAKKRPELKCLPVKFGYVKYDFRVWDNDLTTLDGFPTIVGGNVYIANNPNLKSLKHLPLKMLALQFEGIGIFQQSLIGIEEALTGSTIKSIITDFHNIKSGGLGLLLVAGVESLKNSDRMRGRDSKHLGLPEPFKIIEKYLGRPEDIFECQAELIENGFEEYAQL